jgi:hypothetical protein
VEPVATDPEQPPGGQRRGLARDDHRGRFAEQLGAQPLAEPGDGAPLERVRQLPGGDVEQGDDGRDAGEERQSTGGSVIDRTRRAVAIRTPGGAERGTRDQERVDRQGTAPEQARGRQQAPAHHVQPGEAFGRIVEVGLEQQDERLAGEGRGIERGQQPVEIGGGDRRPVRILEGPRVEDDAEAGRPSPPGGGIGANHAR